MGLGFYRVVGRFGQRETATIPELLASTVAKGREISLPRTTYFLGRQTLIPSRSKGMALGRKILFPFIARNARSATSSFGIPPNRVIELGIQIEL